MNPVAEEILSYYGISNSTNDNEELTHYGMPRRSGRYPWGSGDDPYQHNVDFLSRYDAYKKQGLSEIEIAEKMGIFNEKGQPSTGKLRLEKRYANDERRLYDIATAKSLQEDGLGPTEIGRKMGINESTVRSLLNPHSEARTNQARNTANFIREQIDKKGMIDVGTGVEKELNISPQRLEEALFILEKEGYPIYKGGIPQATNAGKQTNQKVICPPGTPHKDIYKYDKISALNEDGYISRDNGQTFDKFVYPKSMDSKRMMVRYKEDGGELKDGIVELRRGVDDLSLGDSHYAQVRILVDDKKYIKGMAVYSDNMPDGIDVIFNTNKSKSVPKLDVLKDIKDDPDNPFGSLIKPVSAGGQSYYIDKNGKKQLSLINKRADEGDWTEWKDALPSQFLGKQSLYMINKQLDLAKATKAAEYDEIVRLNNPTIKKHLLEDFANNCDAAAVNLKAAALPGQKYHVIIPINSLKDNEVYAPQYESGSKVALIRYPHGGTFEIPILTVNNKNVDAKKIIGTTSIDAIGITKKNADRLSGADFDGDTVMVIPTHDKAGKVKITSTPPLKGLEEFDPKDKYGSKEVKVDSDGTKHYYNEYGMEYRLMTKKGTQTQMGIISNLITDMTIAGADEKELAAAVRHSMVVIDAEKHKLDYKRSEIDNNISALTKKYQVSVDENGNVKYGGASTILSRAKNKTSVLARQGNPYINTKGKEGYDPNRPEGALIYKTADASKLYKPVRSVNKKTGEITLTTVDGKKVKYNPNDAEALDKYRPIKKVDPTTGEIIYTNKRGNIRYKLEPRTQDSTQMAETDDARTLISKFRNPKELAYANYANYMKALANQARKEMISTPNLEYNKQAKDKYINEYNSLMNKLLDAEKNKPRERAAQRIANAEVAAKKQAYYDKTGVKMDNAEAKKLSQQALSRARTSVGSISRRDRNIDITDKEWEAIQAGAISENKLKKILNNTDVDKLKQRATPRTTTSMNTAQINRAKAMSASNFTLAEIAKSLGVSTSTVSKYLKGA